jgi:hypothetical protein
VEGLDFRFAAGASYRRALMIGAILGMVLVLGVTAFMLVGLAREEPAAPSRATFELRGLTFWRTPSPWSWGERMRSRDK